MLSTIIFEMQLVLLRNVSKDRRRSLPPVRFVRAGLRQIAIRTQNLEIRRLKPEMPVMPDGSDMVDAQPGAISGTITAAHAPAVCEFQRGISGRAPRTAGIERFPSITGRVFRYRRLGLPRGLRG
jgi:hypothetical protein